MSNKLTRDEWAALVEVLDQGEYWVQYKQEEGDDVDGYEMLNGRVVDATELLTLLASAFDKVCASVKVEAMR